MNVRPDPGKALRSTAYLEGNHMPGVPAINLNNGNTIPQLGFGVFQIKPEDTAEATGQALEIGYRHIDTAQMYGNEKEVGEAVAKSGLDRGEVFITSKLNNNQQTPDEVLRRLRREPAGPGGSSTSTCSSSTGRWRPVRDFIIAWKALEEVYRDGRARSIGVSNFQPHHMRRLKAETEIPPAVNQIEVHPYLTRPRSAHSTPSTRSPPRPGRRSPRARSSTTPRSP